MELQFIIDQKIKLLELLHKCGEAESDLIQLAEKYWEYPKKS